MQHQVMSKLLGVHRPSRHEFHLASELVSASDVDTKVSLQVQQAGYE